MTAEQKMPRPWFRANATAQTIGAILMSADDVGLKPQAPSARVLGRFVLPPFQRPAVWTTAQKVRFVESIWAGLPLGAYVYNQSQSYGSPYDQWLLDGQQRITAILEYVADQFSVNGYVWSELTRVDHRMFKMTPMGCMETQIEDEALLREIYDRLVYGGTPHAPAGRPDLEVTDASPGWGARMDAYGRGEGRTPQTYEFRVYGASPDGDVPAEPIRIESMTCFGIKAAKAIARTMALDVRGPVDVAVAGASPWADRYITTAAPTYPADPRSRAVYYERLD